MGDLIIKPEAGGSIKLQNNAGTNALVSDNSGNITLAGNTTLSGTANNLGTVTAGNLSNEAIVMPRFKELDHFVYETVTSTTSTNQNEINISGSNYLTITPEHTGDIIQFSYDFNVYGSNNYLGFGVQSATNTGFTANVNIAWRTGQHAVGRFGHDADYNGYHHQGGTVSFTASSINLSADTTYYFRMIGMTHVQAGTITWGGPTSSSEKDGIKFSAKRWSIV